MTGCLRRSVLRHEFSCIGFNGKKWKLVPDSFKYDNPFDAWAAMLSQHNPHRYVFSLLAVKTDLIRE